jgi:hypothetical protein
MNVQIRMLKLQVLHARVEALLDLLEWLKISVKFKHSFQEKVSDTCAEGVQF